MGAARAPGPAGCSKAAGRLSSGGRQGVGRPPRQLLLFVGVEGVPLFVRPSVHADLVAAAGNLGDLLGALLSVTPLDEHRRRQSPPFEHVEQPRRALVEMVDGETGHWASGHLTEDTPLRRATIDRGRSPRLPALLHPHPSLGRGRRALPRRRQREGAVRLPRRLPLLRAPSGQRRRLGPGTTAQARPVTTAPGWAPAKIARWRRAGRHGGGDPGATSESGLISSSAASPP